MGRKIEVIAYDPDWPIRFSEESEVIRSILGNELIAIHHIGSTAIPGIYAKPIIDILPVVREIEHVDNYNPRFVVEGYEPMGEFGLPGRRYFKKGGDNRTHHLHIYQVDNPEIDRHLAFRDYMIAHPEEALVYANLKRDLAEKYSTDIDAYCDGKDEFVKERERRALEWKRGLG